MDPVRPGGTVFGIVDPDVLILILEQQVLIGAIQDPGRRRHAGKRRAGYAME